MLMPTRFDGDFGFGYTIMIQRPQPLTGELQHSAFVELHGHPSARLASTWLSSGVPKTRMFLPANSSRLVSVSASTGNRPIVLPTEMSEFGAQSA